MSPPGGPVTANSIAGQMGGLGSGTSGAPVTGYPDPGNPAAMSPNMNYYSTANPFAPPPTPLPDLNPNGVQGTIAARRYGGNPIDNVQPDQQPMPE